MSDEATMPLFGSGEMLKMVGDAMREDFREYARARRTDPSTSHQAAQSVKDISTSQKMVLALLNTHGPMHDQQILFKYREGYFEMISESGLRSRRAELVAKNLVQDSGQRITLPSGRKSIVWEAV
jgi:hypothetical protein